MRASLVAVLYGVFASGFAAAESLSLDGSWSFRFEEGKPLEEAAKVDFAATDSMPVPACYDMMPKWYMKRGTGLYRRTFDLAAPIFRSRTPIWFAHPWLNEVAIPLSPAE